MGVPETVAKPAPGDAPKPGADAPTLPAYMIVCGASLGGSSDEYERKAGPLAQAAGLVPIAGGMVADSVRVLEGALPPGVQFLVVERFESMQALEAFYFSPEYQSTIPLRKDSVRIDFLAAVAGIPEPSGT